MPEVEVGKVSDFFAKPVVAGIQLTGTLRVGDKIHIKGHTTDLELIVESMQIERVDIIEGKPGDAIGIKVPDRVRPGDAVYKVTE
jgi:putative protease